MSTAFIYVVYLILALYNLRSIFKPNIGWQELFLLFLPFIFKVGIGSAYGIYLSTIVESDTWTYFNHGLSILNSFKENGVHAFTKIIPHKEHDFSLISGNSYFEYYRYAVMDWISAFFSFLSGKNYYTNLIFYNFLVYIGLIRLYRFLIQIKPEYSRIFYLLLFFFPPFVFWTSGFHRDGICVTILGFGLYYMHCLFKIKRLKYGIFVLMALILLFFFRSFWGVSFASLSLLWWLGKSQKHFQRGVLFGLIILTIIFFASSMLPTGLNLPLNLAEKQAGFLKLIGTSRMPLERLSDSPFSYFYPAIQGMNHLLLRPYLNEIHGSFLYLFAFIENLVIWGLIAFIVILWMKGKAINPFNKRENCVLISFVLINYLVIAVTVPFLGAIVRYKAPFELLLLIVLVQFIPISLWNKLIPGKYKDSAIFVTLFQGKPNPRQKEVSAKKQTS